MISKYKTGTFLIHLLLLIPGLVALLISIGIFFTEIIEDPFSPLFVGVIVYSVLSYTFIYISLSKLKSFRITQDYIQVNYLFGLIIKKYQFNGIIGYNHIPFTNKLGVYKGLAIKTVDMEILHFSEFEFSNFTEMEYLITNRIPFNKKISLKDDTIRIFMVLGGPVLILLIWYILSVILK